jgi:uncharacterized C2H2 Zn-finger protein
MRNRAAWAAVLMALGYLASINVGFGADAYAAPASFKGIDIAKSYGKPPAFRGGVIDVAKYEIAEFSGLKSSVICDCYTAILSANRKGSGGFWSDCRVRLASFNKVVSRDRGKFFRCLEIDAVFENYSWALAHVQKVNGGNGEFIWRHLDTDILNMNDWLLLSDKQPRGLISGISGFCSNSQGLLRFAGLAAPGSPRNDPQPDSRDSQNARKSDKPKGEISRWIAASLFPEPVIFALLGGAFVGCFIVAAVALYGIKERKCDKQPKRKKE